MSITADIRWYGCNIMGINFSYSRSWHGLFCSNVPRGARTFLRAHMSVKTRMWTPTCLWERHVGVQPYDLLMVRCCLLALRCTCYSYSRMDKMLMCVHCTCTAVGKWENRTLDSKIDHMAWHSQRPDVTRIWLEKYTSEEILHRYYKFVTHLWG
jgi:hypothetical protein